MPGIRHRGRRRQLAQRPSQALESGVSELRAVVALDGSLDPHRVPDRRLPTAGVDDKLSSPVVRIGLTRDDPVGLETVEQLLHAL